jgi:hypothetical protein
MAGQGIDERGIERSHLAKPSNDVFAVEVVRYHKAVSPIRDNQIPAVPLKVPREEQIARNSNGGFAIPECGNPARSKYD